jgi:DNA replication protein DnaC
MTQENLGLAQTRNLNTSSQSEKPSSDSCEHCGSPLTLISLKVFGEEIVLRPACECRLKELEEQERQARINELHQLIRQQGLENGLYARMSLEEWEARDPSCEAVAGKLRSYLQSVHLGTRNWLYLYGSYGLGKTHLAVSALKYLCLDRQWKPLLVRWSEYCSRIQQSWQNSNADSEFDLWRGATNVTLLVLDDIDKRASSEWALGKLYELIDHRYVRQLPTVLTANRNLEKLAAFWSRNEQMKDQAGAIVSRIIGQLSAVIEFSGRDYRFGHL